MASEQSLWFRLGYALERARHPTPRAGEKLAGIAERKKGEGPAHRSESPSTDDLVTAGVALAVGKLLDAWRPRRRAGLVRLARAAAAGAGAALLVDLARPLLTGSRALDDRTGDRLLVGAGQGLVYGAVVEPRLAGPALLKGALFGSAEYAADPAGGLTQLVGAKGPLRRLPVVATLVDGLDPHHRSYLEHVTFGIALAVLYGSSPSSNGILVEDEDD